MSGATAWKPAWASARSWCRQEYQDSGKPWQSTTGGPAPCSATCRRMPFVSTTRCWTWLTVTSAAVPGRMLSRDQDQLAGRLPRFEVAMRVGRLGQRERLADVDLESAVAHEGKAAVGALAHLVGEAPGHARQHEAAHLLGLREEREDVEGVRRSPGAPVQDEVAEGRQAADALLERRLADRVQDEVDAAAVGQPQRLIGELLLR